ncbi:hypothetical protein KOI35_25130 [Actinoplanes bogorensis]|uniref:Uncharacterized protein n=1 Tax=Paractinoplanes bogorensis TaxID=1610840 RepID=A0ABS5YVQ6_9ACTN|nr:hypothetical protein [Actinoplanes bogorensis]MBU2666798.1 hypothetical protein [Actinoplanes bogorensis]
MSALERWDQRGTSAVEAWADEATYRFHYAKHYLLDIYPILLKYRIKQGVRNAVDALPFLTESEQRRIRQWLRGHGF